MRTDVLQRLKALGATDAKIAALAVAFDEDTIAALLGQVEMSDKDAAAMQIAYKEQDMPPTKQPVPAYTERAYQLCDVIDAVAAHRGNVAADLYAQRLLGQTVEAYPQAAKRVLGATEATVYLAAFKAASSLKQAADPIGQLGQQFLALLREAGDDEARTWLEGSIAEMEADDETDDQAVTTKDAQFDPWQSPAFPDLRPR
jgi:hypothetical protein